MDYGFANPKRLGPLCVYDMVVRTDLLTGFWIVPLGPGWGDLAGVSLARNIMAHPLQVSAMCRSMMRSDSPVVFTLPTFRPRESEITVVPPLVGVSRVMTLPLGS